MTSDTRGSRPSNLHIVALGCPKNQVDSERMAGLAATLGLELTVDPAQAEVILVNTCGFIEAASQESVDAVLELAAHKEMGRCQTLVVAGCLAQRYPEELARELPEVDYFVGSGDLPRLGRVLRGEAEDRFHAGPPVPLEEGAWERALDGAAHSAYLKIGEGCDRSCAFCIIPSLRGPQRSRTVASLASEAHQLVEAGARELILVAQDTTTYGRDLTPGSDLIELLTALDGVGGGLSWIRLLYAYPTRVGGDLARALARLPRVVPYLDLPIQHVDDLVLRRMKRGYDGERVIRALDTVRAELPGVALRTTLISGHPGETDAAHQRLLAFLQQARLDHVGVFPFSSEEGTDAAEQPDQVSAAVAHERVDEVMALQRQISREKLHALVGQELEVLVDGPDPESDFLMVGRHPGQAPEIDGVVHLADCGAGAGEFVSAVVEQSGDYDLVARVV